MSMVEPIRIALVKRGNLSESELARRMGISPQNLHNKMNRDNFTESDLRQIAEALGLQLEISFIDPATGVKIV
ncbi:MAG: helix-turn-helix domain-containing protein [Lachnospiraceae bacterium]